MIELDGQAAGDHVRLSHLEHSFSWCPPGQFLIGTPKPSSFEIEELYRRSEERQAEVSLSHGFWIGQCQVTQGEWRQLMGTRPWRGNEYSFYVKQKPEFPAVYVSWLDAVEFCSKLTKTLREEGALAESARIDLPTEAQWEYAARAGTTSPFWFGDESRLQEYDWYEVNGIDAREKYAHLGAQKPANPWGLHDVHGNVSEWCRDAFRKHLPGGTDPFVARGKYRVFRSGGWADPDYECRSSSRNHCEPERRNYIMGIRLVIAFDD